MSVVPLYRLVSAIWTVERLIRYKHPVGILPNTKDPIKETRLRDSCQYETHLWPRVPHAGKPTKRPPACGSSQLRLLRRRRGPPFRVEWRVDGIGGLHTSGSHGVSLKALPASSLRVSVGVFSAGYCSFLDVLSVVHCWGFATRV